MLPKAKATLLMILAVASWGSSFLCWLSWTGVYFVLSARFLDTLTRLHACVLLNLRDFPTLLGKDQQRSQFQHCPPRWCEHGQSSFQRNQWTVKNVLTTREVGRLLDKNIPFVCNVTNIYCQLEKCRKYFLQLRKHQRKSSWLGTGRRKYHSENPNLQKWRCWGFSGIEIYLNGCIKIFEQLFVYFHQCWCLLEIYFDTPGHIPLQSTNLMKCNPLFLSVTIMANYFKNWHKALSLQNKFKKEIRSYISWKLHVEKVDWADCKGSG